MDHTQTIGSRRSLCSRSQCPRKDRQSAVAAVRQSAVAAVHSHRCAARRAQAVVAGLGTAASAAEVAAAAAASTAETPLAAAAAAYPTHPTDRSQPHAVAIALPPWLPLALQGHHLPMPIRPSRNLRLQGISTQALAASPRPIMPQQRTTPWVSRCFHTRRRQASEGASRRGVSRVRRIFAALMPRTARALAPRSVGRSISSMR